MAMRIFHRNISGGNLELILNECYAKEKPNYQKIKKKIEGNVFKMYNVNEFFIEIPYYVGITKGFRQVAIDGNPFPWYQIAPLIYDPFENDFVHDKSRYVRPFLKTLRDYQLEQLPEILGHLKESLTVTLGFHPGWGKTLYGAFLSWLKGLRTLVMFNLEAVMSNWIITYREAMPEYRIWVVGETPFDPYADIILCMDGRFSYIPEDFLPTIGTFIIDEAHIMCKPTNIDNYLKIFPKYVILESATFQKEKANREILFKIGGRHGCFIVSKIPHTVYVVKTGIYGDERRNYDGDLISSSLQQSLTTNRFRFSIICNILINNCEYNKFIIIRTVKSGLEELAEKIRRSNISADTYYGTDKTFNNCIALVTTASKAGVGMDYASKCSNYEINPYPVNCALFEHIPADEEVYEQERGRALRAKNPSIIILLDENESCKRCFDGLKPHIRKTNGNIVYVSYYELFLPLRDKIYTRIVSDILCYRICTQEELMLFQKYRILDENDEDRKYGGSVVFLNKENICRTLAGSPYFLLELQKLVIVNIGEKILSYSPILASNCINVIKL